VLAVFFFASARDLDRQNLEAYIRQNGQRQRQVINSVFNAALSSLDNYSTNSASNQLLLGVLLAEVNAQPTLPSVTPEEATVNMNALLLDANNYFDGVRLLNSQGLLVASAGDPFLSSIGIGSDESSSQAYRSIITRRQADPSVNQVIVVTRRGQPVVEIVQTVRLRDTDNVLGYLVANLDLENTILPLLTYIEGTFPAYSFLLSDVGGVIIALPENEAAAVAALDGAAVERARLNESGFSIYDLNDLTDGQAEPVEIAAYYAPVDAAPFILVSQVATEAVYRQTRQNIGAAGFSLIVGAGALLLVLLTFVVSQDVNGPIRRLQQAMRGATLGNYEEPVIDVERQDELGDLARVFVDMRRQVQATLNELELRISSRTRDFEITQEISQFAVSQRDLQRLMDDVTGLIVRGFPNIYHAQIFLLDIDRRFAVLRASTGVVGQEMMARGHRLAVGSVSVIGQVTAQGETIIARDTASSEIHRRNEFLPDTRAELAIPLRIGERIIGALDVQSKQSATFNDDQVKVLQTMAAQVAIAIENARLYQDSVSQLRSLDEQNRNETLSVWREFMFDQRQRALFRRAGITTDADLETLREQALSSKQLVVGKPTARETVPFVIPIVLRGEVLGVIATEVPSKEYNQSKVQLAKDLADRLALTLDNVRLFEQSQRATDRERLVNEIAAKLTTQTDVNEILQTAVREVGQAIRAPQVSIRLSRKGSSATGTYPTQLAPSEDKSASEPSQNT
jgi:GAF domain-containing protein/HAMP domain-containing protein